MALLSPLVSADAVPLSEQHIAVIRANCSAAQQDIQAFRRTELVTRSNRSNKYEDILRLMAAFNARASINKINISDQTLLVSQFEAKLNTFRQVDYKHYDEMLGDIVSINCSSDPVKFYNSLTALRDQRTVINQDIKDMDAQLDQFGTLVNGVRTSLAGGNQ